MGLNPLTILLTVTGGLIVAGLLGWIRKPRLVTLVPRTFSYSQITDRGQLIEITVFNRSFKTEEAIDVTLNPMLRYEMLGSNSQDASVSKNKIQIPRIGPSDEVTTLLIVEGGNFKSEDIVQTLSKETKGKTVSKLEEVPPTGAQRIGLVAGLILMPAMFYAATIGIDFLVSGSKSIGNSGVSSSARYTELQGWKVPNSYRISSESLFLAFESKKIVATVGAPSRRGDVVTVPVQVNNMSDAVLRYTLSMTTAQSEKRIPSYERHLSNVVVVPGKTEERSIKVIVPERGGDTNDRLVFMELFIEKTGGETLALSKDFAVTK